MGFSRNLLLDPKNSKWRRAAILEIVKSPYLNEKSSAILRAVAVFHSISAVGQIPAFHRRYFFVFMVQFGLRRAATFVSSLMHLLKATSFDGQLPILVACHLSVCRLCLFCCVVVPLREHQLKQMCSQSEVIGKLPVVPLGVHHTQSALTVVPPPSVEPLPSELPDVPPPPGPPPPPIPASQPPANVNPSGGLAEIINERLQHLRPVTI